MRLMPRTRLRPSAAAILLQLAATGTALAGSDAGLVAASNGAPTVTRGGMTVPLRRGDAVRIGDRIDTDAASKVKILLNDDSVLAIGPRSQVTLDELVLDGGTRTGRLGVLAGRFKLAIADWLYGPSDYQVKTPTAIAGVRGTVLWGDTELDAICALRGHVEVKTLRGGKVAELGPGRCVTAMGRGETTPLSPSREELEQYLREVSVE